MKYITSRTINFDKSYGHNMSISAPDFSRLLDISISGIYLVGIFESPQISNNSDVKKFNIKVIMNLYPDNFAIDESYIYLKTIRLESNDYIDYYHIFVEEVKSLSEIRDEAIDSIIQ